MNNEMDNTEFLINFFSSLTLLEVKEVNYETLSNYFRDLNGMKEFTGVLTTELMNNLSTLELLNTIKIRRFLKHNTIRNNITIDAALKFLGMNSEEDIISLLSIAVKYRQYSFRVENKGNLTYEEIYSPINRDFIKNYYDGKIKMVLKSKGNI